MDYPDPLEMIQIIPFFLCKNIISLLRDKIIFTQSNPLFVDIFFQAKKLCNVTEEYIVTEKKISDGFDH